MFELFQLFCNNFQKYLIWYFQFSYSFFDESRFDSFCTSALHNIYHEKNNAQTYKKLTVSHFFHIWNSNEPSAHFHNTSLEADVRVGPMAELAPRGPLVPLRLWPRPTPIMWTPNASERWRFYRERPPFARGHGALSPRLLRDAAKKRHAPYLDGPVVYLFTRFYFFILFRMRGFFVRSIDWPSLLDAKTGL